MDCSTPANEDPCQVEKPKAGTQSIPKKVMAVVVRLRMIIETLTPIIMLLKYACSRRVRRTGIFGTRWGRL